MGQAVAGAGSANLTVDGTQSVVSGHDLARFKNNGMLKFSISDEGSFVSQGGTSRILKGGKLHIDFGDSSGNRGKATINKSVGRCALGSHNTELTVTDSLAYADSKVFVQLLQNDTTCKLIVPTCAYGTITFTADAPPAADSMLRAEKTMCGTLL